DDLVDAYEDQPDYWVFVPLRYVGEPMLRRHFVPRERRIVILRETRIVNRPVRIEGRRIWVNPGLPPVFIASRAHVNISAYQVRPRVFARTTSVQGAITVHAQDLKVKGAIKTVAPVTIQRAKTEFKPQANVVAPQPLGKKDPGKLGPRPPLAATVNPTPPGGPQ